VAARAKRVGWVERWVSGFRCPRKLDVVAVSRPMRDAN